MIMNGLFVSGRARPKGSMKVVSCRPVAGGGRRHKLGEEVEGSVDWKDRVAGRVGWWIGQQRVDALRGAPRSGELVARWTPITRPVAVVLEFVFAPPASGGVVPDWPCGVEGDLDKLTRCVLDGLTQGGLIADDRLVCRVVAEKRFEPAANAGAHGVYVTVEEIQGAMPEWLHSRTDCEYAA